MILSGSASPLFQTAERIARAHHERFDGGGYPDGLVGEAIPVAARIVSACDAFNAMTTDRAYRKAMPRDRGQRADVRMTRAAQRPIGTLRISMPEARRRRSNAVGASAPVTRRLTAAAAAT